MHRRKFFVLALAAVAVAAVGLTGASGATGQLSRFQIAGGTITGSNSARVPLALSNKKVTYILEMSAKPVAAVDAASKAAGHGALSFSQKAALTRQIMNQQAPVIASVRQLKGASVSMRYQGVYNGISVTLPQRDAWKLGTLSGVKAVFATKTYQPAVAPGDGIPLVNAPQTWGGTGAYTGTGMKIADIDTGLDYTHADFGGTGTTAAFNCAAAHSTDDAATFATDCPGVSNWYSGSKVKGGIDLVGDSYNAATGAGFQPIPHPDDNPLDCNGHGSHTAGTAAGFGVDHNGNQYSGAYDANTINNESFIIPPGVAPNADLYGVRVFGCAGSVNDDVLLAAMDWSFTHGMDVVNMSLGASFGSPNDPDSVAADNLASEGVITVLSSGNSGVNPYITGSPAAGPGALAVAANDSTASFPAADLTLSTGGPVIQAINANGAGLTPGTYNLKVLYSNPPTNTTISIGCRNTATGANPLPDNSLPPNTILVIARGTCARVAKAIFAQQAGAAGVIMVNNSAAALPPYEGPITADPDAAGPPLWGGFAYTVTVPFLGVKGGSVPSTSTNGAALRAADGGTVTIAANTIANPAYLGLASFTSWGPSAGGLMKPEVTAPGVSIISAGVGKGNGGVFLSGTSMAAPHTTGAAALVKQAHPSWGAVQFWKDALVNTANTAMVAGYAIRGAGSGEIDAYNATHTNVVADGSPAGTASLSFGQPDLTKKFAGVLPITLHNFSNTKQVFVVSSGTKQGGPHTIIITTPNSNAPKKVTVPAHGTAVVSVELDVYKNKASSAIDAFNNWWGVSQFNDVAGLITFTPTHHTNHDISLHVPYYAVPTAVSNLTISGVSASTLAHGESNVVTLKNKGGAANGVADWFSLSGTSGVSATDIGSADLLADGVQSFPGDGYLVFGLSVSKAWRNPAAEYFEIDVDVNNDGTPDYAVLADDNGAFNTGTYNGQSVVIVYDLVTNAFKIHFLTNAMFNGTTMELPVLFSDLCQPSTPCVSSTPIKFQTFSQDRNGGADSITSNAPYNVMAPSLITSSVDPMALDENEDVVAPNHVTTDSLTIDPTIAQGGILVLSQNSQNTLGEAFTFGF